MKRFEDIEESVGRKIFAPIAHLFTRSLPAVIVVGLASGIWQYALLAAGLGVVMQALHAITTKSHRGEYTAHPVFSTLGAIMVGGAIGFGPRSLWLLPFVIGLLIWETGWHRWQHRFELAKLAQGYNDDRYPYYARYWAWCGLGVATLAAYTEHVRLIMPPGH